MNGYLKDHIAPLASLKLPKSEVKRLAIFVLNAAFVGCKDQSQGGFTSIKHTSGAWGHFKAGQNIDLSKRTFRGIVIVDGNTASVGARAKEVVDDSEVSQFSVEISYDKKNVLKTNAVVEDDTGEFTEDVVWNGDRQKYLDTVKSIHVFREKLRVE